MSGKGIDKQLSADKFHKKKKKKRQDNLPSNMARGGSKHRGGMRGGKKNKYSHDKNKGRGKFNKKPYNKQDSTHLKTFGEAHPSDDVEGEHPSKRRKFECAKEESSDDDVDSRLHDPYTQLLSTFSSLDHNLQKKAIESDESEDTDASDDEGGGTEEPYGLSTVATNREEDVLHDSADEVGLHSESDEAENSDKSLKSDTVTEYDSTDDEDLSKTRPSPNLTPRPTDTELHEEDYEQIGKEDEQDEPLDPFIKHFYYDMDDVLYETVSTEPPSVETFQQNWPVLGHLQVQLPKAPDLSELPVKLTPAKLSIIEEKKCAERGTNPTKIASLDWSELHIKPQISNNISKANSCNTNVKGETSSPFTPLQKELFSLIRNYQDVYFPYRTLAIGEEVRFVYCLHAVNHALKTRSKIIHHNAKLAKKDDVPEEFRDQGLVRPKVVILVPFRESALRVVRMIIAILFQEEKANVMHMKRFVEEHSGEEISMPKKNPRPEDYEATFAGNTDDTFRIGMTVTKKSLKLYADFYSADIIVASPLGLRVIVGAEGEAERDFDFLASIELLVLDQTELFLMQNWDHLLHVLDHFHLQPKEAHGTDFSRVRSWALNGWTRYYRQTLVFSSLVLPEINALFNKKCHNYAGKIRVVNPVTTGTICQVVVQLPQVFHRFDALSATQAIDARLDFFVKKILPQFKDSMMSHTMVYIPSYFDFVCLRNYFKREDMGFVQICEYSKEGKVARARDMFFHTDAHFLLYSERFHFFRRFRIKGIRHLIFYQPPTFPHLYGEMCNLMHEANQNKWSGNESNMTVTVLYSKYDVQQLAAVVGTDRAKRMMSSERNVHMFMTGE